MLHGSFSSVSRDCSGVVCVCVCVLCCVFGGLDWLLIGFCISIKLFFISSKSATSLSVCDVCLCATAVVYGPGAH